MSAETDSDIFELVMPSRKALEDWDRMLQRYVGLRYENRAARKIIDKAPPCALRENENLWQATLLNFGESPYRIFSGTKGIVYLTGSQFKVGDTSPVFTKASVEHLLSIISHPFLNERSTSETLRLFLQFSVIAKIGARTGWTPPLASGRSYCPALDNPVLDELRKEMSLVSKKDRPSESIYERFTRLTKSHPESVETLVLAKVGRFAQARVLGFNYKITRRQKELYNQEGVCAVSIQELIGICQAIEDVASAKQEMSTRRALLAFKEANYRWLPFRPNKIASVMEKVWGYETYLSYLSQQSRISAEEDPHQCMDNIGMTSTPKSASGDVSEVHKPDQKNMAVECQITREVVAVDTEGFIDDAPKKSLAELWMDENPFKLPV